MKILLSIKPKYVEEIMNGHKKYEFRKTIFKNTDVEKALIYSTSPIKRIVGDFEIGEIIEGHPKDLWNELNEHAGISNDEFINYFNGNSKGYAIQIKSVNIFDEPIDPWENNPNFTPPQSFFYID
ncbi:MAG: hypothetical protein KAS67_03555 [Thermoplasmata archaeon]|nr:hypothetical protein [Thermoplasmata archaeon]